MAEIVVSMFRLTNSRGYFVPSLNYVYQEADTGLEWRITCGGTRCYFVRFGNQLLGDMMDEAADSHFMVHRITSALVLAGAGLFQAEATGRILVRGVDGRVSWTTHLDIPAPTDPMASSPTDAPALVDEINQWFRALCQHWVLRRAANDAHLALSFPDEALIFVYRGLEWIHKGMNISWQDIATLCGVPYSTIRDLKKTANNETGIRHATKDGMKFRALLENYGTWVSGLFDAINESRIKLEPGFVPPSHEERAKRLWCATPTIPYP